MLFPEEGKSTIHGKTFTTILLHINAHIISEQILIVPPNVFG